MGAAIGELRNSLLPKAELALEHFNTLARAWLLAERDRNRNFDKTPPSNQGDACDQDLRDEFGGFM